MHDLGALIATNRNTAVACSTSAPVAGIGGALIQLSPNRGAIADAPPSSPSRRHDLDGFIPLRFSRDLIFLFLYSNTNRPVFFFLVSFGLFSFPAWFQNTQRNETMASIFSLEGSTAVVTGATRGIGQAVAIGLAEAGADIILIQVRFNCRLACLLVC